MSATKIKTIIEQSPATFDAEVNKYLAEGYILNESGPRQVGPQHWKLYARLVLREDDA